MEKDPCQDFKRGKMSKNKKNPRTLISRTFFLIVTGVCVGFGVFSNASTDSIVKDSIEQIVNAEAKYDLFSGAILVAEKGEVIYSGAFGLEDKAKKIPNKLTTKFSLGSIGKTFTGVLIMQLVEQGRMKLSDTLEMYLPDFPFPEKSKILISHLLTHSSGLGNYFTHKDYGSKMKILRHIKDVLPLVYDQKLLFQPGEKYQYSNSGMLILGAILEKVSGMSYREYLKKQILIPAGMNDSGIFYPEEPVPDRAIGYSKIDENKYLVETEREFPAFSDGGLYSTVLDMLKYDRALSENKLLIQKTKETMFSTTGPSKNYALGWETGYFMEETFVGHVGGCPGFAADFIRFPEKQRMIIVLSNYTETGLELAAKIKHLVFTGGKSNIPVATQYDYNFRKGRDLGEFGKQYKKAVKYLDKNIQGDEPHLPSLYSAARARIFGKFEEKQALELLDRYLRIGKERSNRTKAAVWWLKGQAYEQLGNREKAIENYETSLKLDPKFSRSEESLKKLKSK
jgi:CubicO group peptidase (beta-lactamase class C family)